MRYGFRENYNQFFLEFERDEFLAAIEALKSLKFHDKKDLEGVIQTMQQLEKEFHRPKLKPTLRLVKKDDQPPVI